MASTFFLVGGVVLKRQEDPVDHVVHERVVAHERLAVDVQILDDLLIVSVQAAGRALGHVGRPDQRETRDHDGHFPAEPVLPAEFLFHDLEQPIVFVRESLGVVLVDGAGVTHGRVAEHVVGAAGDVALQ